MPRDSRRVKTASTCGSSLVEMITTVCGRPMPMAQSSFSNAKGLTVTPALAFRMQRSSVAEDVRLQVAIGGPARRRGHVPRRRRLMEAHRSTPRLGLRIVHAEFVVLVLLECIGLRVSQYEGKWLGL